MRRRLLVSYLSITLFVLVVLGVPLGIAIGRLERRELTSGVRHDTLALSLRSEEALERGDVPTLTRLARDYRRDVGGRVVITDERGVAVTDSDPPERGVRSFADRPEIVAALRGREAAGTRYSATLGTDLFYVAAPIVDGSAVAGAVRVTYPTSYVDERVRRNWIVLGAVAVVVLGVVFLVSLVLARSVTRPLADLEVAAARLGGGELSTRAEVPPGPPEVRSLARSLNGTAARLERLVGAQRAFVADASHQLRSPLAALRLRLENLDGEVRDPAASQDVTGALAEVARLSRLVDGLLALARVEAGPSAPVPIDLTAVVDGRRDAWSALAAERRVRLVGTGHDASGGQLFVRSTPGVLEQVLDNVLNNALDVAPEASVVTIGASARDRTVELTVADEGVGMTAEQRERAFDRFWRSGDPTAPGAGLGLAIVHRLVEADGGTVKLDEAPGGGLLVRIRLDRARPPGGAVSQSVTPASA